MNILSTTNMSKKHQDYLRSKFPQHHFIYAANDKEGMGALPEADVLVTFGKEIDVKAVEQASRLKWLHVMAAGVDQLPFEALMERELLVTNAKGIHAIPIAEYTFAVMLQITRSLNELAEAERAKRWASECRVTELWGKTLGIVGVGSIGKEIARRAKVFGMTTLGVNTDGRAADSIDEMFPMSELERLLVVSDFVVLTVPLLPSTHHLIDAEKLRLMKESAYLVNIARGSVVDEQALIHTLSENRIAGAVLDVFEQEPLPPNHPFWTMDNVMITPHISGRSPLYMTRAVELFTKNLTLYSEGKRAQMHNVIDLALRY